MSKKVLGVWVPSEPPKVARDPETHSDEATMRVIRGRGFVLTFSSHFAVAVIVGVLGWVWHEQHAASPATDEIALSLRACNEGLTALRADFTQFKAEAALESKDTDQKLNLLIIRTDNAGKR